MFRPTASICLIAMCTVACGPERSASVISSTFDQRLPTNGKVFVFVTPPLDVVFDRVDPDPQQRLAHEAIGGGTSRSDVAYIVDPGEVSQGDTVDVQATCDPACPERSQATITFDADDDVTPPVVPEGDVDAVVNGVRDNPISPFIARYQVTLRYPEIIDDHATYVRFHSDELDALRPGGGMSAFIEVDGGIQRRFCFDADLMDAAGNETPMARDLCVELDPSTAPAWGVLPPLET